MKTLVNYIQESIKVIDGSKFKEEVKYSLEDMDKWQNETKRMDNITIYKDTNNGLFQIYMGYGSNMKHIATYLVADEKLMCDDTKLFGI